VDLPEPLRLEVITFAPGDLDHASAMSSFSATGANIPDHDSLAPSIARRIVDPRQIDSAA